MKKSIIALGVAAALGGFAVSAGAQVTEVLKFNPNGVGHILLVPYFSTQGSNVTALSIVNTDPVNGKALKVRFRGASNSDDVFDFQVFLSPNDVWTAGIYKDTGTGLSRLETADKSCTLPASVNRTFIIDRTSAQAADRPGETREGYVEIFNMGDIYDDGSSGSTISDSKRLYNAVKHVSGVAPCGSVLTELTNENATSYLSEPTTGLMANWFIVNVDRVLVYSGEAAAIEARTPNLAPGVDGVAGQGRVVYWDQRSTALNCSQANSNTSDPLLRWSADCATQPAIAGARYDLPDLSTPYTTTAGSPFQQARDLSDAIATRVAASEFYNEASLGASTDIVVSFPSRRYFAAVKYGTTPTIVRTAASDGNIYFTSSNTELGSAANGGKSYQICSKLGIDAVGFYDREETATETDDIVISPGTPLSLSLCGEVSVVGVNGGALSGSATFGEVARANIQNGFTEGWGFLDATGAYSEGLPFLARQFTRISNTITNQYYGLSFPARIVEKGLPIPFGP